MQCDLCRHIKTNGLQCHGVAVTGSVFCYFHRRLHRSHDIYRDKVTLKSELIPRDPFLNLPALEDRESIQIAVSSVVNALATGCIDERRAYALFKGLRLASCNCQGMSIGRRPAQMVREVHKETWTLIPEANLDIAPPGLTCEIDEPAAPAETLSESPKTPPTTSVILSEGHRDDNRSVILSEEHRDDNTSVILSEKHRDDNTSVILSEEHRDESKDPETLHTPQSARTLPPCKSALLPTLNAEASSPNPRIIATRRTPCQQHLTRQAFALTPAQLYNHANPPREFPRSPQPESTDDHLPDPGSTHLR